MEFLKTGRRGQFKYIYYHNQNAELYDIKRDPKEENNLAGNKDYDKIEKDLRTRLQDKINFEKTEEEIRQSQKQREFISPYLFKYIDEPLADDFLKKLDYHNI